MKLGHVDPEMHLSEEERKLLEAEGAPAEELPSYRPKYQHVRPWSEAERARNPKHYESASYSCLYDAETNKSTVRRLAWKGIPEVVLMHTNNELARKFMDWAVQHDREVHQWILDDTVFEMAVGVLRQLKEQVA